MITLCRRNNKKGQATTEFAIMGSVVLMVLLFMVQQAFIYRARQGIEMYTFRQALLMSKNTGRGIDLTVMRDIVTPSLFSSLSRERMQASSSVDANPWDLYTAPATSSENSPGDIPTYQLLQIGEAMIQNGQYIQVPLTKVKVTTDDGANNDDWSWKTSSIREFDAQHLNPLSGAHATSYSYRKFKEENNREMYSSDTLESRDQSNIKITFQNAAEIKEDYVKNDWEGKIGSENNVSVESIPANTIIMLDENLRRIRTTEVPND